MAACLQSDSKDLAMVRGRLDFDTVLLLEQQGNDFLQQSSDVCTIDLSAVTYSGSVGLALLLAWYRRARAMGKDIRFIRLPEKMMNLMKVSALDEVMPVQE